MSAVHQTSDQDFFAIRLELLCPVHIGTGETLSPLTYIMTADSKTCHLHHVDLGAWIEDRLDKKELADRFAKRSWQENRSFLAKEMDPDLYTMSLTEITDRSIYERYQKEIIDTHSPNQLLISEAMRSPLTKALFIPGSSIKGAIRTAVIDYLDRNCDLHLRDKSATDNRQNRMYTAALEGVLGKITENAFQALKVGDFPALVDDALLVEPLEKRRKQTDKDSTPKNLCETTRNKIMTSGEIHELYGRMSLGKALRGKPALVLNKNKISLDIEKLFAVCTEFYRQRYEAEREKFYRLPQFSQTLKALEAIEPEIYSVNSNQTLLRVGHYSHVECMTVTNNAPQTPKSKGKNMPFGTTRTLANGVFPFGWIKLSICEEEDFLREETARKRHDFEILAWRKEHKQLAQRKIKEQALRQAEQEAKRQQELEAEKQRQAELEALPQEKRLLLQLKQGELNENQVVEFYDLLDSMDEETRLEGAQALKLHWQQHKKWDVKPKQKKQYEKVSKVKMILKEES